MDVSSSPMHDAGVRVFPDQKDVLEKPDYLWLLAPVSDAMPAGRNLEFDPEFYQLEVAATPGDDLEYGNFVVAAAEVDWRHVMQESERLMRRSRDLRLLVLWHRAAAALYGIGGLVAGFHVLRVWLETMWPSLHPELESGDSTARWLCVAAMPLNEGVLGAWRRSTLFSTRAISLTVKDFSQILNRTAPQESPSLEQVQGILREAPVLVRAVLHDIHRIRAEIRCIDEIANGVGTGEATPNLNAFERALGEIEHVFAAILPEDLKPLTSELSAMRNEAVDMAYSEPSVPFVASPGCHSRSDAVRMVDEICSYYALHEPSHPAPLLMRRAQKMMQMGFMEIMNELLPDSVPQIDALAGARKN